MLGKYIAKIDHLSVIAAFEGEMKRWRAFEVDISTPGNRSVLFNLSVKWQNIRQVMNNFE